MSDLLAELGGMTGPQWWGSFAMVATMFVVGIGVIQGLFKSDARAERERQELALIAQEQRLREQGLIR